MHQLIALNKFKNGYQAHGRAAESNCWWRHCGSSSRSVRDGR